MWRNTNQPILGIPLLVLLCGLLSSCAKRPPAPPLAPPKVVVSKPIVDEVLVYTDLTGYLDSVFSVDVRPRVSGYIQRVHFADGKFVHEGDLLVEIDPRPYQAELDKAIGEVNRWEAQLKFAEADLARIAVLVKSGSVSKEEYEKSLAQRDVAFASLSAAKAAVAQAKLNLDWTKVTAPISGRIDRIYQTEGNVVTGGMPQGTVLTTIVSVDPIYAYFDVDDQTVLYYQKMIRAKKLPTAGTGDAIIEMAQKTDVGYPYIGMVDFVSNRINPSTGSLQIRGIFRNPDELLKAGRFVRARIPANMPQQAVLIPEAAIFTDQGIKGVYVVNEKNQVETRTVQLGPRSGSLRIVTEGIRPEDRVVIRGVSRVRQGMTVEVEEGKIEHQHEPVRKLKLPEFPELRPKKKPSATEPSSKDPHHEMAPEPKQENATPNKEAVAPPKVRDSQ